MDSRSQTSVEPRVAGASSRLMALEFRVFRLLLPLRFENQRVLAACSGGMDSVALVQSLYAVSKRLGFEIEIAHVHHGASPDPAVVAYRERAARATREFAGRLGVPFHELRRDASEKELKSETELRDYRRGRLFELYKERSFHRIALAHHADDLLETRLIRLLRGTGPQGLRAMTAVGGDGLLRPFLEEPRAEIAGYAQGLHLIWEEDPSNRDRLPLRNWIRHELLPLIEEKRAGAVKNLGRALDLLAEAGSVAASPSALLSSASIDRRELAQLGKAEQRRNLATVFFVMGTRDFTAAHVDEVLKRVLSERPQVDFSLAGLNWRINAGQVEVTRA